MARNIIPLAIAIFAVASTSAFTFTSINPSSAQTISAATAVTTTAVNLVPEQGRQLVAFSQDYLSKRAKESAHRASNLTNPRSRQNHHHYHKSSSPTSSSNTHHQRPGIVAGLVTRLLGQHGHQGKGRTMMENHIGDYDPKSSPNKSGVHYEEVVEAHDFSYRVEGFNSSEAS